MLYRGLGLEGGEQGVLVGCEVDDRRGPRYLDVLGLASPSEVSPSRLAGVSASSGFHLDAEGTREGAPGGEHLAQLIHGGRRPAPWGRTRASRDRGRDGEKERRHRHRGVARDQIGRSPAPAALEFTPGAGLEHVAAILDWRARDRPNDRSRRGGRSHQVAGSLVGRPTPRAPRAPHLPRGLVGTVAERAERQVKGSGTVIIVPPKVFLNLLNPAQGGRPSRRGSPPEVECAPPLGAAVAHDLPGEWAAATICRERSGSSAACA